MGSDLVTVSARARILSAALELFLERGVLATSIDDLCRASGASVGSLYHHFGGKEGVAAALYVDALVAYQGGFVDELGRHEGAEEGVRGTVFFHLHFCESEPGRMRFLLDHGDVVRSSQAAEALREHNRAFFAQVRSWWRPHVRYGAMRELELELLASLWIGPAQEYCRLWLAGHAEVMPRAAAPILAQGAWNALRTKGG